MFAVTPFQQYAVLLIAIWLLTVVVRFRRSRVVLTGGLFAVGLYTLVAFVRDDVSMQVLGLSISTSWLSTIGFAVAWLALMLAYSPLADRVATRWADKPPTLGAFRTLQQSRSKLFAGIAVAWVLGGFLEELTFRGIILQSIEGLVSPWLVWPMATGIAVCTAAAGAGLIHLYQGSRAVITIIQLSVLFGVLFVVTGYNLWAVVLCHGLYDTIALIRFANKKSKYSKFDGVR
jgi:membrane protease YdiL (CAAX protease family)